MQASLPSGKANARQNKPGKPAKHIWSSALAVFCGDWWQSLQLPLVIAWRLSLLRLIKAKLRNLHGLMLRKQG